MKEDQKSCNVQFAYFTMALLGILMLTVGKNIMKKIIGLVRPPQPHPFMIHLHKELDQLRKTTQQINKDWAEMNQLVSGVRDQQNRFMFHLQSDLEAFHEGLTSTLSSRLSEEGAHAELRSAGLARVVEALVTQVEQMRQGVCQEEVLAALKVDSMTVMDGWSQTDYKKKLVDGKMPAHDQDTIKTLVLAIKQALVEFLKDAQKNLTRERLEMMENVRVIFTQMVADREDIKAAIAGAFSASSQQTQRCFEQLGILGRDAVGCIVSLGEKSEMTTDSRFQDLAARTRDVSRSVKVLDVSVASIKDTLDTIDNQFDEIYRKLELGHQTHSDQCGEIAEQMSAAVRDFSDKSNVLDTKHKQMVELIGRVNEAINRFNSNPVNNGVDACGQGVELLRTTLEQFVARVEKPVNEVVHQTMRLTDMIEIVLEVRVSQSALSAESTSGHDMLQYMRDSSVDNSGVDWRTGAADFKALMKGMYLNGVDRSAFLSGMSSSAPYNQDTHQAIQS